MLASQGDAVDAINPSVKVSEADRIDRLRLIRSDNVGPRGIMAQTPQAFRRSTDHLKGVVYAWHLPCSVVASNHPG
jgi:hypothetical protein